MNDTTASEQPNVIVPTFPVAYGKSRVVSLLYLVNATQARQRLATVGMVPLTLGNKALFSISWFDYEASELGPYRELSVGLVTDSQPDLLKTAKSALVSRYLTLGTFVLALPVTSPLARTAGVEKLGLPKTVMELPLTWSKGVLDATALEDSKRVLSMRIPLGFGPWTRIASLIIYSRHHGELLRTTIVTDFRPQIDLVGRPRLTVEDRGHPLTQELDQFDLETAPCLGIIHGPMKAAKLLAPEIVGS
jgi:hypothetical protein